MLRFHPHSDLATSAEPSGWGLLIVAIVVIAVYLAYSRNRTK